MGIMYKQVALVNRAPVDLDVTHDGQTKRLSPGVNYVPEVVVQYAKNQNPIMGSADPYNPHISGAYYLVGVEEWGDNVTPLTEEEWQAHLEAPTRENAQTAFQDKYGSDPKARLVTLGKGRKTAASSRVEAGGNPRGQSSFSNRE